MGVLKLKQAMEAAQEDAAKQQAVQTISSIQNEVMDEQQSAAYAAAHNSDPVDDVDSMYEDDDPDTGNGKKKRGKSGKSKKKQGADKKAPVDAETMYKRLRIKKYVVLSIAVVLILSLLGFGIYTTFVKEERSDAEIIAMVNQGNMDTPFPTAGLEGFVANNANDIFMASASFADGAAKTAKLENTYITMVSKKSPFIANVYFSGDLVSSGSSDHMNFMIPVSYDYETQKYAQAGDLEVSPLQPATSGTEKAENPFLSFENLEAADPDTIDDGETFVQNFLTILYNQHGDVSSFYKGAKVLDGYTGEFMKIHDFVIYQGYNENGYNAKCTYSLRWPNGVSYQNTIYLDMVLTGNTWRIDAIL